ncbi:small integral membrane protein 4 [Belonocnema kinseyi]|uniref:small integral membrane protein 4 n=1 Tax=Belonocnema kinseyi TaxID=2817044 RepID=UPI00143CE1BA|nr:small integral membrane protein 4 [Belonocnema kinseyi]
MRRRFQKIAKKWPGEKYFGEYRFLPLFFVAGAALEFCMINWHVGEVNFYRTYKKKRVEELVNERLSRESSESN